MKHYWFILVIALLTLGCRDDNVVQRTPSADPIKFTVTANSGGCSNFQVYHYSDDRAYGLLLSGDSAQLGLSTSWQTYALDQPELSLTLYEFRQPLTSYFCDDVVEANEDPLESWDAQEGSIRLKITGPGQVPGLYSIDVVLENVLVNGQRLDRIARNGIEVGWLPG